MNKFSTGVIVGFVSSILVAAVAPPQNPSWWKEVDQDSMDLLALHIQRADEITVSDANTVARLYFDHMLLDTFEEVNRQLLQTNPAVRASPQDILDAIDRIRTDLKAEIVKSEKAQEKKQEEIEGNWRTYPGKDA